MHNKPAVIGSLLIVLTVSCISAWAQGRPTIRLSKQVGPPTTRLKIAGSGFTPNVGVSISFDSIHMSRTQTDASGAFSGAPLMVPQKAMPGDHTVSALDDNGVIAFAPFVVQTDWPQFHFASTHTGYNPYEFTLSPATVSSLKPAWSAGVCGGTSPVVAGGVVYVSGRGGAPGLNALDANSGTPLWTFSAGNPICVTPAVSGGLVFVADWNNPNIGHVYALKASTGTLVWSFTAGDAIYSTHLTVANGVVYVVSVDGTVYALKASTGALVWSVFANAFSFNSPAVANGIVYVAAGSSCVDAIVALNASTGTQLWNQAPGGCWNGSSPAWANGVVYAGFGPTLYALNATSGAPLWSFSTGGIIVPSPAVAKGTVYFGSFDWKVYALNAKTGAFVWSYVTGDFIDASPAVANGVVYISSNDGYFYALDASNGSFLWSYGIGGGSGQSPAIADGSVYVTGPGVWAFR